MASRTFPKHLLSGLATCITKDAPLSEEQVTNWKATKALRSSMFDPKLGGSYEVFNQRPLPKEIVDYCIQDVMILPSLATTYDARLSRKWRKKADLETARRLEESRKKTYEPHGDHKKFGPTSWSRLRKAATTARPTARHHPAEILTGPAEGDLKSMEDRSRFKINPSTRRMIDTNANEDWALCDKDCGWCEHCGKGVL